MFAPFPVHYQISSQLEDSIRSETVSPLVGSPYIFVEGMNSYLCMN